MPVQAALKVSLAALLSVLLHAGFMLLALVSLYRGLELENCGCFGVFLARPLTWSTPFEDLALVLVSLLLFLSARKMNA